MIIIIAKSEGLNICNHATGASVVRAHMWDNDSIRKSDLAVNCLMKVHQTKEFSVVRKLMHTTCIK